MKTSSLSDLSLERERQHQLLAFERSAKESGHRTIVGIDEAGRGPLAGPVVAAACLLPHPFFLPGIDDSKKLSSQKRAALFSALSTQTSLFFGIGQASPQEIDEINILQATRLAMFRAVEELQKKLDVPIDILLVDGLDLGHSIPSQKIIKGDSRSLSIAAASIAAKETRDEQMLAYDKQWPAYGFAQHKGYGTQKHRSALKTHGPCPIHRFTFAPIKEPS